MFKNLTVGKKIGLGFASLLVLTAFLGGIGVYEMIQVDTGLMDMADVHGPLSSAISEIDAGSYDIYLQATLYTAHKENSQLEEFATRCNEVVQSIEEAKKIISTDEDLVTMGWLSRIDDIDTTREVFMKSCNNLIVVVKDSASTEETISAAADDVEAAFRPYMENIDSFLETNDEEASRVSTSASLAADRSKFWMVTISITAVVIGLTLAFFIARGVITALKRIIDALTEGSEQVSSASQQVSSASQSLAEGSTEQAAGLEETSSSLEEMSSMTRQNADNAQQANTLAAEARKAADNGTESMARMNTAIQEIQKSSDETAKIIKVIDEIAFQTNLLALNAAVEAARAGEAGKGFAVVAEEVRNLAMRSAEAAKNTSSMIEESVKNSKNGVDIAGEVAKVLDEIVQGISKTTDLVSEIAAASQEQAQGIDQVNTAVAQMDKVTQQNAANAEESASASEELSAQAESMNEVVNELVALVGGTAKSTGNQSSIHHSSAAQKTHELVSKQHGLSKSDNMFHKIAGGSDKKSNKRSDSNQAPKAKTAAVSKTDVEKAIPLDDDNDDLSEFNS